MTTKTRKHRSGTLTKYESELRSAVRVAQNNRHAIASTMARHELGFATEAIALHAFETFYRRTRGIRPDHLLVTVALSNVMADELEEPFLPNRQMLDFLNERARDIVNNRSHPRPWLIRPKAAGLPANISHAWQ
mgnify:CR=1 FL=1